MNIKELFKSLKREPAIVVKADGVKQAVESLESKLAEYAERLNRQEELFGHITDSIINMIAVEQESWSTELQKYESVLKDGIDRMNILILAHADALEREEKRIKVTKSEFMVATQAQDVDDGEFTKMLNDLFKQGWRVNGACQHAYSTADERWFSRQALVREVK